MYVRWCCIKTRVVITLHRLIRVVLFKDEERLLATAAARSETSYSVVRLASHRTIGLT